MTDELPAHDWRRNPFTARAAAPLIECARCGEVKQLVDGELVAFVGDASTWPLYHPA